jgi:iron complex transport system substrate-binding protein
MRYARRSVLGAVAGSLALLAAACAAPAGPPTAAGVGPGPIGVPTPGAATRVVPTALGEVSVPAAPRRIVTIDNYVLGNLLALGVTPVGSTAHAAGDFLPYLRPQPTGVEPLGLNNEPSLEKIVRLKPDLIIGTKTTHERLLPQLREIAPTVLFDRRDIAWRENFVLNGETVGRRAEAEALLTVYRRRLGDLRGRMGDRAATTVVATLRSLPDHIRHMLNQSFGGGIVKEAGLPRPPMQDKDGNFEEISDERIPDLAGATVIYVMRGSEKDAHIDKVRRHPLWAALPAVQAGRVYEAPLDIWLGNPGIQAANLVVDDLIRTLVTAWT